LREPLSRILKERPITFAYTPQLTDLAGENAPSRSSISRHEIPKEWNIGMNKVTRIPAGATRRFFSLLFLPILSVLQIPTIAFASANADSEGYDMRICLNKTLSSRFSRIDDKFTATVVDAGPFNQAKIFGH
jgi:hypothetical protein